MIDYRLPLDELPDPLPIEPLRKPFDVSITPPGSKSITCRAYVLAALANGQSRIIRPLRAEDTDGLLKALCTLGATAKWEGEDVLITGVNGRFPRGGEVNLGDGGTPTRFMIACACLAKGPVVVDGSPRMRERPIAEGVELLRQLGANIEYVEQEGRLPVRITPSDQFKGGELTVGRTASSQFISALMLIGPCLPNGIKIRFADEITSATYLALTEHVTRIWRGERPSQIEGQSAQRQFWSGLDGLKSSELILQPAPIGSTSFNVEPDASSAVYWFVAAWLNPPSRIRLSPFQVQAIQSDLRLLLELKRLNLSDIGLTMFDRSQGFCWWVSRGRKTGKIRVDCTLFPDGAMAFVVGSSTMKTKSRFTGLRTLRVKETDRVAALANELTKVGCRVEIDETDDDVALVIRPMPRDANGNLTAVDPVVIETYNDHRMAMAFAVLGLVRPGLSIRNPACVAKSYPGFWRDFQALYDG